MSGAVTLALILSLFVEPGCTLDSATLDAIPPSTVRVVQIETCGGVTCWRRYLLVDDQRRSESRVCETDGAGRRLVPRP